MAPGRVGTLSFSTIRRHGAKQRGQQPTSEVPALSKGSTTFGGKAAKCASLVLTTLAKIARGFPSGSLRSPCPPERIASSHGFEEATGDVQLRASANDPKQIEPDTVTLMVAVDEIGQKTVGISLLDATSGAELASLDKIDVTTVL
jgi:hypothetical protein